VHHSHKLLDIIAEIGLKPNISFIGKGVAASN
jgi:hypothetical protein